MNNEGNWINCQDKAGQQFIKSNTQDIHRGKSIELELGDVLLYQGPNIPHWRNTLVGDYSYHMFLHFFNQRSRMTQMAGFEYQEHHKHGVVPNSSPNSRKFILDWDGCVSKWDNTRRMGAGELEPWIDNVYSQFRGEHHLYVNNYSYLTGKVEEDLIVSAEDLE